MSELQFNNDKIKRIPINRNNLFYSEESFKFEEEIGKNYIEQDMNQTLVLYQVDLTRTNLDTTYNETGVNNIQFKTPVEFHCVYKIDDSEAKTYNKSLQTGVYIKPGKLTFGVYQSTLDELDIDIHIGDYIGVLIDNGKEDKNKWSNMMYYTVSDDGRGTTANNKSMYGYKPFYRHCTGYVVDQNEFNGK